MVNRATKRLMAKQQRAEARGGGGRAAAAEDGARTRAAVRLEKKERTPPRQFLREVRGELKKVAWPSRTEVTTYTFVVLISVLFVTALVFGLDYGLNEAVFRVFSE